MSRLQGKNIYLDTIKTKEMYREFWDAFEFDMDRLTEYPNIGHPTDGADKIFEYITKNQGKKCVELGMFTNDGRLIGDIDLHAIEWKDRGAEIGIAVARKADRGKGYGTEAFALITAYAFNAMGLERLCANTLEHNTGCRRALEKNGFIQEGVNRRAVYIAGRYYDRVWYSLLHDEYKG